jgi:hypothetical protein
MKNNGFELVDMADDHVLTANGLWRPIQPGRTDRDTARFASRRDAELTRRILLACHTYTRVRSAPTNAR